MLSEPKCHIKCYFNPLPGLLQVAVSLICVLVSDECSFLVTGINGSLDFNAPMSTYSNATNCLWLVRVNRNKVKCALSKNVSVNPNKKLNKEYKYIFGSCLT